MAQDGWTEVAASSSVDETKDVAARLGRLLQPGDVILLSGDLGAGKTQFAQGIATALCISDDVVSPTFNLVLSYEGGRLPLHHFDLYRLDDLADLEDIALREYLEADGVCLVEWAEKFPSAFDAHLVVSIAKTGEDSRLISACAHGERARALLETWMSEWAGEETTAPTSDDAMPAEPALHESPTAQVSTGGARGGSYVLAFDTANEVVAIGLGRIEAASRTVELVAIQDIPAHRASNTTLIPAIDRLMADCGIARTQLACICAGRGPGSFTGVRIAMATAKGMAQALGIGLVGIFSLDAVAWSAQRQGIRGDLLVVADAMRKEVYPAWFTLDDAGVDRRSSDCVVKAQEFAASCSCELIAGDALFKYRDLFEPAGQMLPETLWQVSGHGLLLAFQDAWRSGAADPWDAARHDPAFALPVYTRLSDAEENERLCTAEAAARKRNLRSGVQDVMDAVDGAAGDASGSRLTMHARAHLAAPPDEAGIAYRPFDAADAVQATQLEAACLGTDAWSEHILGADVSQRNRTWWTACDGDALIGYAGGLVVDGDLQILKVVVAADRRRRGIARQLLSRIAEDARNLGAASCSLEVRASNDGAQAFYRALGLTSIGTRPRYYSDGEDALIMKGPLPLAAHDVAGMRLAHLEASEATGPADDRNNAAPLILAFESSCDETAGAVVDGQGALLSDVVASQIDFHARFGGVVPEIASRKHIEAICGVAAEALDAARVGWADLDAVAVTYAPGLVGALVVGLAFAKGAAWARDIPLICVNHLEGHLYANRIGDPDFEPPAVVSLVSGGNTMLVHMRAWGDYETLGTTIDDAVGEAFDKVAKALGLGYPGGPAISKLARTGDPDAIAFPRALMYSHDLRFSLSGLKTAVMNYIEGERSAGRKLDLPNIAASFQQAVIDVQVSKARAALQQTDAPTFCLGGGVAANPALRAAYEAMCAQEGVRLVMPPLSSCGDNAGMIALVALDRYRQERFAPLDADAHAHADLDVPY